MKKIMTQGKVFTNAKLVGERAVRFEIAGKGECVLGFAKDRNAFMEAFNGEIKEVTRLEVLKRLDRYQGADVVKLMTIVRGLKPVTMNAGHCSDCGCELARGEYNYSMRKFGRALCREHQRGVDRTARQVDVTMVNIKCSRCGGSGKYGPREVHQGICFKCEGAGHVSVAVGGYEWRRYTESLQDSASVSERVEEEDVHQEEWEGRDMDFVDAYDGPEPCAHHDAYYCPLCEAAYQSEQEHGLVGVTGTEESHSEFLCLECLERPNVTDFLCQECLDKKEAESEFNPDLCFDCEENPHVDGLLCQECLNKEKAKHVPQSEPKPKRKRGAAGVGKDKESQTQRGGRKASAGGKGTSAKSAAKGA